jgi:RNA polymerase sigma-70 factor (ECF subfamily)
MVAAQAGDRAAYETLLRDCIPFIKRVARGQGIRPDLIDDVVQETLLTVHRARQTYDPNRSFTAWLRTIAQRRAIDVLREVKRTLGGSLGMSGSDPKRTFLNLICCDAQCGPRW